MSQEDIITQVTPDSAPNANANLAATNSNTKTSNEDVDFNSLINLNLRGTKFTITRDELMSLPESILLCLFPNGVFLDVNGQIISNLTEEDVVYVNFDPGCFQYIIDMFRKAQRDLASMSPQQQNLQLSPQVSGSRSQQENILQTKPAIIVLREDLDFYVIPPIAGLNREDMRQLKKGVSVELLKNKLIFSGLGYKFDENDPVLIGEDGSVMQDANEKQDNSKGLGAAEQHLFDMLCSSGFDTQDKWGSRSLEPGKCVISSLSLVRLKTEKDQTPSETPPDSPSLTPVASHASANERSRSRPRSRIAQLASSASRAASRSLSSKRNKVDPNQTKLLLFWRKPARKCWWSHGWITINIDVADIKELEDSDAKLSVKVHVRRVWTLELSIIT
ncbi:hypothetical protein CANMA_000208 [Candida margitis]|uniref:uncharacterized protein n=1 Tax=Candida margitis TaxID=1775924 RepID=UPI002226F2EC|nr:uncharacterized protein CANMA_000208 [Candida margitis]KAI5970789.1 hypothetical protein CANMA_000208 [Candida margitis]